MRQPVTDVILGRMTAALAVMIATASLGGCAAKAREMPLRTERIETGADTVETVRRQFEGTWDLQTFEIYPSPGKTVPQKARAVLIYDAFGNMTIDGRLEQPDAPSAAAEFLSYKGRIVIDLPNQQLRVVDAEGDNAKLPAQASTNYMRKYAFEGNTLVLSMVNPQGQTTAKTTWKKRTTS